MLRAGYNHWCKDQFLVRVSSLRHHCHVTASPVMLITMVTMVSRIQKCRTNKIIGLEKMFRTPPPQKKKKRKKKGGVGWAEWNRRQQIVHVSFAHCLSFYLLFLFYPFILSDFLVRQMPVCSQGREVPGTTLVPLVTTHEYISHGQYGQRCKQCWCQQHQP